MFKSLFTKYIAAFMLIIFVSFAMIIAIITSIIGGYSEDAKADMMETAAKSSSTYLQGKLSDRSMYDMASLITSEGEDIEVMLSALSSGTDDMTVLLTDHTGRIVLAVGSESAQINSDASVPSSLMNEVKSGAAVSRLVSLNGVFEQEHLIYAVPICDQYGSVCGTVVVCSSSVMLTELLKVIVKTIIIAILLVLLAVLIAIYFISDRIIAPLKEISRAAKQYAAGKFGTRVPVRGEDEVAELAVAFNNMAESLDNYDTMRNTFMSNVSHDLRSPMTSISGFIDSILDGAIPPEQHTYYLRLVSDEIKRLSRLVASLLDLSRIQAGERKFTPVSFDICEMGRQILISFEQKINEKHLEVEFDVAEDSMIAVADRDAIYQVLYNLCDNAVKFASEGGLFRMSAKRLKNKKILVSVYNDGQGISAADLPYVFERFYKSDKSRGLNKSGVGLGLFISKTIMEAHEERIWVESNEGQNCCFHFTLTGE